MKTFVIIILIIIKSSVLGLSQSTKKTYNSAWANVNLSALIVANNYLATGFTTEAGVMLSNNFKGGVGYSFLHFSKIEKINTYNIYLEKSIKDKSNEVFLFVSPGFAKLIKGQLLANSLSGYEYTKTKMGYDIKMGVGIRWMVKKIGFTLATGYEKVHYELITTEYPVAINPYNPFYEESVKHTLLFKKTRVFVKLGISIHNKLKRNN